MRGGMGFVWLVSAVGCNRSLDSIEGYDLGRAKSAAWAKEAGTERVMVVASDDEAICELLADPGGATPEWTLSVWTTAPAAYEEELPVEAVAVIRDGILDDDYFGDGTMRIDDANGDLEVHVDVGFGPDRVNGRVRAAACDADLFAGVVATDG